MYPNLLPTCSSWLQLGWCPLVPPAFSATAPFWHHGLWYQFKCIQNSKLQGHSALTGQFCLLGVAARWQNFPFLSPDTLSKTWLNGFSESQDRAFGSFQFRPPSSVRPHSLLPKASSLLLPLMRNPRETLTACSSGNAGQVSHTLHFGQYLGLFLFIELCTSQNPQIYSNNPLIAQKLKSI